MEDDPNADQWAAAFLRTQPDYTEACWIDTCAKYTGRCGPELTGGQAYLVTWCAGPAPAAAIR